MSGIHAVVAAGYGPQGSVARAVTRGFDLGPAVPAAGPSVVVTAGFGPQTAASIAYVVTRGFGAFGPTPTPPAVTGGGRARRRWPTMLTELPKVDAVATVDDIEEEALFIFVATRP